MGKDSASLSAAQAREERLAAKLRENLRRRKVQARQTHDSAGSTPPSRLREGPGEGLLPEDVADEQALP